MEVNGKRSACEPRLLTLLQLRAQCIAAECMRNMIKGGNPKKDRRIKVKGLKRKIRYLHYQPESY
jgi:hypothetical protein